MSIAQTQKIKDMERSIAELHAKVDELAQRMEVRPTLTLARKPKTEPAKVAELVPQNYG